MIPDPAGLIYASIRDKLSFPTGEYRSGQTGQIVNLLAYAYGGSSPSSPT